MILFLVSTVKSRILEFGIPQAWRQVGGGSGGESGVGRNRSTSGKIIHQTKWLPTSCHGITRVTNIRGRANHIHILNLMNLIYEAKQARNWSWAGLGLDKDIAKFKHQVKLLRKNMQTDCSTNICLLKNALHTFSEAAEIHCLESFQ